MRTLLGHTGPVLCVAHAPSGTVLASGSWDHSVRLWDCVTGSWLHVLQPKVGPVFAVAFSPEGNYLAVLGTSLAVYELRSDRPRVHRGYGHGHTVPDGLCLAFAPDGSRLAVGGASLLLFARSGTQTPHSVHCGEVLHGIAFTPDSRFLAVVGPEPTLIELDGYTRHPLSNTGRRSTRCVACAPTGGDLAWGGLNGGVTLWRVRTQQAEPLPTQAEGDILGLAFLADDRTLVSANIHGKVDFLDRTDGRPRYSFQWDAGAIRGLSISPEGTTIAAGCFDNSVLLWDLDL